MSSGARTTGFLLAETILFALASLAHAGRLLHGFEHARAAIAEAVIATVLGLGFLIALVRPVFARRTAIGVQVFALLGVLVGVLMIIIGVGPGTALDVVLHAIMLAALAAGLFFATKAR